MCIYIYIYIYVTYMIYIYIERERDVHVTYYMYIYIYIYMYIHAIHTYIYIYIYIILVVLVWYDTLSYNITQHTIACTIVPQRAHPRGRSDISLALSRRASELSIYTEGSQSRKWCRPAIQGAMAWWWSMIIRLGLVLVMCVSCYSFALAVSWIIRLGLLHVVYGRWPVIFGMQLLHATVRCPKAYTCRSAGCCRLATPGTRSTVVSIIYIYIHIYIYIYICTYVCIYVCMYIYIYISCVSLSLSIYIYIYTWYNIMYNIIPYTHIHVYNHIQYVI